MGRGGVLTPLRVTSDDLFEPAYAHLEIHQRQPRRISLLEDINKPMDSLTRIDSYRLHNYIYVLFYQYMTVYMENGEKGIRVQKYQ